MFSEHVEQHLRDWLAAVATATEENSVAAASRQTGISRKRIENVLWTLQEGGATALRARAERAVRRCPRYLAAVRREVILIAQHNPSWGRKRIARVLAERGLPISGSYIRRSLTHQR